jgi:hypothetical protein
MLEAIAGVKFAVTQERMILARVRNDTNSAPVARHS